MEQTEEMIKHLLNTFFKATQIESLYFDCQLNAVSCQHHKLTYEDFLTLSKGKIECFLLDIFEEEQTAAKSFYTYFLDCNLVCNIFKLDNSQGYRGAVVTRPVLLNALKESEIEAMLDSLDLDSSEHSSYKQALRRAPVVPYDRIKPMGEVLGSLSCSIFDKMEFRQILHGGDSNRALHQFIHPNMLVNRNHKPAIIDRYADYPTYLKIKDSIFKGDKDALLAVMNNINAGSVPMDQLASKDFIRSLKNSFIKICSMGCFIAVDAGASYIKTVNISQEFIKEVEDLRNINDIYELLKSALLTFTKAVAITRIIGHSKPVRLAIEYIQAHFSEKITLEMLAQHVNLSESYLSTLMKQETGLDLADNINKIRIEESKKLILTSNLNMTEVASRVGYTYSNHFARIFKSFTGMAPQEFKNNIHAAKGEDDKARDVRYLILDQLNHIISTCPNLIDAGRIVDHTLNMSWIQKPDGEVVQDICYNFWNRGQSCDRCISRIAFEQNKPFMKLDQSSKGAFFVFALPINIGNTKYVVELLKNVSEDYFDYTDASVSKSDISAQ